MSDYKIFSRTEKSKNPQHKTNEDSFLYTEYCFMNDEKIRFLIVGDGIGSMVNAEMASRNAVEGFAEAVYSRLARVYMDNKEEGFSITHHADRVKEVVKSAFCEANRNVCRKAGTVDETGTTLSVVAIVGDYAVVANIGDSPVYYYNSETDEFKMVSCLHTVAERDAANGVYERYSDAYYAKEHILESGRSLGECDELDESRISVREIGYLHENDQFLIGSDGAFGRMMEEEILEILESFKETQILKNLFSEARMDKDDDQTAILYKICKEE